MLLTAAFALSCTARSVNGRDGAPVDVPLLPYLGRLVTIDALMGQDTVKLLLDTGAGETLISPELAARLACRPSGRSVGFRMSGERVEFARCPNVDLTIGGVAFPHTQIGVWDVQKVLPPDAPKLDGVLSLKTLASQPFTLRLQARRLTLETRESFAQQVTGMTRLTSRIATGADGDELTVFLLGRLEAQAPAWFLLDSGNLDAVQAAPILAGARSGETWDAELTLDGLKGARTRFRTRDIIYDGALSEELLRQWIFAFDLAANAVWAAPAIP